MRVLLIAALSADGFIGRDDRQRSLDWTSAEDKKLFVSLTKQAGVMVMGSRTFDTIGRGLPGRRIIVYTSRPERLAGIDGVDATDAEPRQLVDDLSRQGRGQLAVCGGAAIYGLFLRAGLVDELYLTVEPVLFGAGVRLLDEAIDSRLSLLECRQLNGDTLLLHYQVVKS